MVNLKKWCVNSERWNSNSKQSKRKTSETCQLQIWEGLKKRFGGTHTGKPITVGKPICVFYVYLSIYIHIYKANKQKPTNI